MCVGGGGGWGLEPLFHSGSAHATDDVRLLSAWSYADQLWTLEAYISNNMNQDQTIPLKQSDLGPYTCSVFFHNKGSL